MTNLDKYLAFNETARPVDANVSDALGASTQQRSIISPAVNPLLGVENSNLTSRSRLSPRGDVSAAGADEVQLHTEGSPVALAATEQSLSRHSRSASG